MAGRAASLLCWIAVLPSPEPGSRPLRCRSTMGISLCCRLFLPELVPACAVVSVCAGGCSSLSWYLRVLWFRSELLAVPRELCACLCHFCRRAERCRLSGWAGWGVKDWGAGENLRGGAGASGKSSSLGFSPGQRAPRRGAQFPHGESGSWASGVRHLCCRCRFPGGSGWGSAVW
jgi:hypothetical protein